MSWLTAHVFLSVSEIDAEAAIAKICQSVAHVKSSTLMSRTLLRRPLCTTHVAPTCTTRSILSSALGAEAEREFRTLPTA